MRKAALTEAQIRKHLADNLSYLRQAKTPKLSQQPFISAVVLLIHNF